MVEETKVQPQADAEEFEAKEAGAETPQPEAEETQAEPGAGEKPQAEKIQPEKSYTESAWRKRESEKDKEIAQYKEQVAQSSLQAQIKEAEAHEREARAQDKAQVEQGLMSEEEAKRAQTLRQREQQVYIESLRINADKESISKVKVAEEIAKEYGIESKALLTDDVKSPAEMIKKASGLALKQRDEKIEQIEAEIKALKQGEQKFDSGQKGVVSVDDSLKARYPSMFKNK